MVDVVRARRSPHKIERLARKTAKADAAWATAEDDGPGRSTSGIPRSSCTRSLRGRTLGWSRWSTPFPMSLSPEAPEGFTGGYDVWDANEAFGLWTLHTWLYLPSPDGVFSGNNPLAPQESAGAASGRAREIDDAAATTGSP